MKVWRSGRTWSRDVAVWIAATLLSATSLATSAPNNAGVTQAITVTEGTNIAATLSPDHGTIIMDLQGVLWSVPIGGGTATRLTVDFLEPARPDWSPTGNQVAFEAYAGGTFHIWTMNPDGSGARQLTDGHYDDREPRFSPDGTQIAFSSDRGLATDGTRRYEVWVLDIASGNLTQRTSGTAEEFEPAWSPDGSEIAFVNGSANGNTIDVINAAGERRTVVPGDPLARVNSPSWSPDGSQIAYIYFKDNKSQLKIFGKQVAPFNDVFPFPVQWLSQSEVLYTADGKIRITNIDNGDTAEVSFEAQFLLSRPPYVRKTFDFDSTRPRPVKGIVSPALSPDGRRVVFEALNELWLMEIGGRPRQITADGYFKTDPAWSPDGRWIAYSSDKAGTQDIYALEVASGRERRLTSLPGAEVGAAWSPDGNMLAFQDQSGPATGFSGTFTLDLTTGDVRRITPDLFAPSRPTWSSDGKHVSLAALKPYTSRFREGTSQFLTVDLETGELTYREPMPFKSTSTRGDDGPVWSPDGSELAFVMDEVLWVLPVDPSGEPTGPAQQLTNEPTAAPTWSGDSQQLLYLSNDRLRLVSRTGSRQRTVPLQLDWRQDKPRGRTIIRAGKLWQGVGPQVLRDVDIVVVANRIASIEPHRDRPHSHASYIDASKLTVIPGLWESHTHQMISGKPFGDRLGRLWLSYGVTTLHSVGDPAYRGVEGRESLASGSRVGPRLFATGEALDGERLFYNFMRPTTTEDAMQHQLSRGRALEYDMVKTYVRLPHAMQARVARAVHDQMGVWTSSHYMLPGLANGMDGQSHVSATTRLGFAYTRSGAGVSYRDMIDLFRLSGAHDTSTTFNEVLLREDPGFVDDQRIQILYPPWEIVNLQAKLQGILTSDPTVPLDSLQKEEATVRNILRGGGIALAGTDSPLDNPGLALHFNLRSQVHFGLAPYEALQTATRWPAKVFGVEDDLGMIAPGKLADLVFINGDPLQNIADLANVQSVMKNGRLYTIPELMAPFQPEALQSSVKEEPKHRQVSALPASKTNYWWHDDKEYFAHCDD